MGLASEVPRVRRLQLQPLSPRLIPLVSLLQTPARSTEAVDTGRRILLLCLFILASSAISDVANR